MLPAVTLTPPKKQTVAPTVELTLTPEPGLAVGEPALTKPEPVVLRAKARGSSTPSLGTVVTAQTLLGEENDRTERAPDVALDADELELTIDVVLEESEPEALQPLLDPEPSIMPDVLTAMVELHAGVDADEAPTRLRDVVTESRPPLEVVSTEPAVLSFTAEPEPVEDEWLTPSSLEGALDAEPSASVSFVSESVAPELHDAPTWDPGPVICIVQDPPAPTLLLSAPPPEPSPYAPAVLPVCRREVSELLDSFHVSAVAEERELRSALKEMAGLELTPMPRRYVDER